MRLILLGCTLAVACSHAGPAGSAEDSGAVGALLVRTDTTDVEFEGTDDRGIPHYALTRTFSAEDSALLLRAYGIENPHHLYISDSTEEGILKYDTEVKRCRTCYVNSYRIGYVSVRLPGESWEQAERRVRASKPSAFAPQTGDAGSSSLADLDPEARPVFERMLGDARPAGFHLTVKTTYRSPRREAALMARGGGHTHTLTSNHSYGRAIDVEVDTPKGKRSRRVSDWIAFRRWVAKFDTHTGVSFRLLGTPERTWDWGHVELPTDQVGFGTIDAAVGRARACLAPGSTTPCDFRPNLPARLLP